jgi:hypothetical protein
VRKLLKRPLTWMVIGECLVVTALIVVAWILFSSSAQAIAAVPVVQASAPAADAGSTPTTTLPVLTHQGAHSLLPGLNLDSAFWRFRLGQLNRDQVFFEQLEWRIIHSGMDAVNRYLETVVLPSITRAEGRR